MSKVIVGHFSTCADVKDWMLVDMHSHSTFSDGRDDIHAVIAQAKKLGIGLAVTDHNEIKGSLLACREMHAIPGMELTSKEAFDVLVYFAKEQDLEGFYKKYVEKYKLQQHGVHIRLYQLKWSMPELLDYAKEWNAFTVLPHPDGLPPKNSIGYFVQHRELLRQIDAVEGINAIMKRESNAKAMQLAREWKKPMVGGSDAHLAKFLGAAVTACRAESRSQFFEAILQKKNIVVGDNLRFMQRIESGFAALHGIVQWNF